MRGAPVRALLDPRERRMLWRLCPKRTVYISDQFFNKTLANLKENQKVAITFWGDEGAYQIHGTATYINEGEQFEELKAWVDGCFAAMGAPITAKGGVLVHVDELFTCSPGPNAGAKLA